MKRRIQLTKFKQETGIKVGDMMTRKLILINPETSVKECVKKMLDNKIGTVLVTNKDKKLLGLITKLDILRLIPKGKDLSKVKAGDIMIRNVKTIRPDIDLYQAIILMRKTKKKKMPVIENDKVIGMLNAKDIVRFEPQLFEHIAEAMTIREETEKLRRLAKYREHRVLHGIEPRGHIEGPCEECGNFDLLEEVDGRLLCSACRDKLGY